MSDFVQKTHDPKEFPKHEKRETQNQHLYGKLLAIILIYGFDMELVFRRK
jgi:hypothetical protein